MNLKVERSQLSIIEKAELNQIDILKEIINAVYGTIFITENKKYMGWINLDIYANASEKTLEKVIRKDYVPCIKESENIVERVQELVQLNPFLSIIPVVNEKREILYAMSAENKKWKDELQQLYISLDKEEEFSYGGMKCLLEYHGVRNIALWGGNLLSFKIYRKCCGFSEVRILDSVKSKGMCTENLINLEFDVEFITEVYQTLVKSDIDLFIVTDWRWRNLVNIPVVKDKCFWIGDLVRKINKYDMEYLRMSYSKKMYDKGVYFKTIGIPNEKELGIPIKNRGNALAWYTWFANEIDGTIDDGKEFLRMRMESSKSVKRTDDMRCLNDYESTYINIKAGCRCVVDQNYDAKNTIYLIGPCIVSGQFNKDETTLGSFLQKKINNARLSYKVVCLAFPNEAERIWYFRGLERYSLKKGDVIFWIETGQRFLQYDISLKKTYRELLNEFGDTFYFDFLLHVGKNATEKIAEVLFQDLKKKEFSQLCKKNLMGDDIQKCNLKRKNLELEKYLEKIKKESFLGKLRFGSIVMNCNPFTRGHRYLIEYASKQVDYLYIFIVEEDKSYFKFSDRIEMVRRGTHDLNNIMVFPSGQFMISANTFSEYFTKDTIVKEIDASVDVELYGKYIAPALGISVRFLGKEPIDMITKQYNEVLKEVLPQYGIEVIEIDRLTEREDVISASRVRRYLAEKDWEAIQNIVPVTTYEYLKEMFD